MIEFRLPSLGSDMDSGTLLQWHVAPGDAVHRGQVVAVVDTAKAAIDVECWHDGTVHALLVAPDTKVSVGTVLAVLREEGESAEAVDAALRAAAAPATGSSLTSAPSPAAAIPPAPAPALGPMPAIAPLPAIPTAAAPQASAAGRQRVTPAARRHAAKHGVDLRTVGGSGPDGAVVLADAEAAAARTIVPTQAPAAATPATRAAEMRKVIAAAMARSKREIPHYYLAEDIPFERAAAWLAARNAGRGPADRLLPAALLLKAVALALVENPGFNGFWRDGSFVPGAGIHLGVAISLREGGLVAPALHDVASKDVATLTRELLDLVKRTRAGALRSSELADATLTVTNLGDQGVDRVFGVIYPPQVALVGFGRVADRPWADAGAVRAVPVVSASLAADHRASDGHRGARLLAAVAERLQAPEDTDRASIAP
jgi:pyruvate dehydrogenase E2 component (dihydrolipoamide acetyltransferase)